MRDEGDQGEALRRAAEGGAAADQRRYAVALLTGQGGVTADHAEALRYMDLAAHGGDQDAQYMLGIGHKVGDGMPVDLEQAAAWFARAALQGHPAAMFELALAWLHGRGVEAEAANGLKMMQEAADRGHPLAQR